MVGIVPHSIAREVDICGDDNGYHYIIRSDAGVYMKSKNWKKRSNIEVFDLHYLCKQGDHYLASKGYFYIVKGTSYRRVKDMNKDADPVVYELHPNCQGGDYYLSMCGKFYIIYKDKGVYRRTTNMSKDEDAVEYALNVSCKDGLYYWGHGKYAHFIKPPAGDWNFQYHMTSNMNRDLDSSDNSFPVDVAKFLPGGLGITEGAAFGKWQLLHCFENTFQAKVDWIREVNCQKGAKRTKLSSIEHNWNIKVSGTYNSGDIAAKFVKYQFCLEKSYGGENVDTKEESWDDVRMITEEVTLSLNSGQQVRFWQYKLGLGEEDILFCPKMMRTDCKEPPNAIPLSPPAPISVCRKEQLTCVQETLDETCHYSYLVRTTVFCLIPLMLEVAGCYIVLSSLRWISDATVNNNMLTVTIAKSSEVVNEEDQ